MYVNTINTDWPAMRPLESTCIRKLNKYHYLGYNMNIKLLQGYI